MANVELFPHNEEAYKALVSSLKDNNLSFIERATGTGKSYILLKYLYKKMQEKRVLFITLHKSMFNQLVNKDMNKLEISKKDFKKFDCVLYHSLPKHDAEWYVNNYDCIIFDEAHHCGAPLWGETVSGIRDLIRDSEDKKMIGATATATRYLDDYLDVSTEYFDSNVASKLYLSDAILREILPAPYYINVNNTSLIKIKEIKKKLSTLSEFKDLDNIRKEIYLKEQEIIEKLDESYIIKKHGVKTGEKYIIFCKNINEIRINQAKYKKLLSDIAPLDMYSVHSSQADKKNEKLIDDFNNNNNPNTIKIMFAVDMFNEGIHIDSVDGIIMERTTASPTIYLQQLGRALSYSTRKKQIKVFDMVGNASSIDVIYNLYKEMLASARDGSDNKEIQNHYQTIIDRFKIVDEGNVLIDYLDRVNNYLDDNYFNKETIEFNINVLRQFINNYKINFMQYLEEGRIQNLYLKAYKTLKKYVNHISYDQFIELNKLGIIVTKYQLDNDIIEKVKIFGNITNCRNKDLDDLMNNYSLFYINNNRRPNIEIPEERELEEKYRNYLLDYPRSKIISYLKKSEYPLYVEELLLLNDYPRKELIDEYLKKIECKFENGIFIDRLDNYSLNQLEKLGCLDNHINLKQLSGNKVINLDKYLGVIKGYEDTNPNTNYFNVDAFVGKAQVFEAIKYIRKNAKHITNQQFELAITFKDLLPVSMQMTLEERLKLLKGYNSFYELEVASEFANYRKLIEFMKKNNRRPNEQDEIYLLFVDVIINKQNMYSKKVINYMIDNNIELTLEEKIIYDHDLKEENLSDIYESVISELKNVDINNFNEKNLIKKLDLLKNHSYIDNKNYKILVRTINTISYIINKPKIYKTTNKSNTFIKKMLNQYVFANQAVIPYCLLDYLEKEYEIKVFALSSRATDKNINVSHEQYLLDQEKINEYIEYINKNGERPSEDSELQQYINRYLMNVSAEDVRHFCIRLMRNNIKVLKEEVFLSNSLNDESKDKLYRIYNKHIKKGESLNALEQFVYDKLEYYYINQVEYTPRLSSELRMINKDITLDSVEKLKEQIRSNPMEEPDWNNLGLKDASKKELKDFWSVIFGKAYIPGLINQMNHEKKSYNSLLDEEKVKRLESILRIMKKNKDGLELVNEIQDINKKYLLLENGIIIEDFINSYLNYINVYHKEPSSEDTYPEAETLIKQYEIIKSCMDSEAKRVFFSTIKKEITNQSRNVLYDEYVSFIEKNERIPSPLSDDEYELSLIKRMRVLGRNFNLEQQHKINLLQERYRKNSVDYMIKKRGK